MSDNKTNLLIYVIRLQDGKYYIGKTSKTIDDRFAEHCSGHGSEWTQLHRPIEVVESKVGDKWEEDSTTLRWMEKYGVDNVRGGSYVQIKLSTEVLQEINRKISSATDKCFVCNLKSGPFCTSVSE